MALRLPTAQRAEPPLSTARTYLRDPLARDWQAWAELRSASREFLAPWEPIWAPDGLSRASYRRRLRRQARDEIEDLGHAFFLFRRADEALLGGVTLRNVQRGAAQSATIGYWMGERHAGNGYMTEALGAVLGHAFGPLGLHRVEAACMSHNERSRRLLGRWGFRQEGVARQYLKINGVWHDHLLFALLAAEFPHAADRVERRKGSGAAGG
jgi:ribosomal-protein-alanine N-acetyltransferase